MGLWELYDIEKMDEKELEKAASNFHQILNELINTRRLCNHLDDIIENSIDGIFISDANAVGIRANRAYEEISGLKRKDLMGYPVEQLVRDGIISVSVSVLVLKAKRSVTAEQVFLKKGKKVLVSGNPIFDNEGNIIMIVSNLRDITELEKMRTELAEKEELAKKYETEIKTIRNQLLRSPDMVVEDKSMIEVLYKTNKVAKVNMAVLLTGETGVGKEEIAKYIHRNSNRSENLFIKINCGAIPENLIESELFGYEHGAFTGASQRGKAGLFEVAHRGSIFLDEIGELQLDMQVKLLRVLESKQVTRIGGTKPIDVDIRVIAATNRDLEQMVEQGLFRQDLYYRLHVVPIMIPPLRNRKDDIIPLTQLFVTSMNKRLNANKTFSNGAYQILLNYHWPGNVRELRNIVENAMVMSESDVIGVDDLLINKANKTRYDIRDNVNLAAILEKIEHEYMEEAYSKYGNVRDAATSLGMSHPTYIRKRKMYSEKFFNERA